MLTLTNMNLVDKHVCIRIIGTDFKRYRRWPSVIPSPRDVLTFNCGVRMTRFQDDVTPGWHTLDHHKPYWNALCSSARRDLFQFSPLISLICSPRPPFKTSAFTEMWRWALRHEPSIFQMAGTWKWTTFLYINTCLFFF